MLNNIPKIPRSFLEKSVIVGNPHLYWVGKDSDSAIVKQIAEEFVSKKDMQLVYLDCRTLTTKEELRNRILVENAENIVLYFDYITEVPETEDSHAIVESIRYILKEGRYFACEYKKVIATSLCSQLEGIKKYMPFICAQSLFEE
jgi:hypothetical protein